MSRTVYPRVYGGTLASRYHTYRKRGLSPRVRGNLARQQQKPHVGRSIPACTGEPDSRLGLFGLWRVYPRVYGGTRAWAISWSKVSGLSPRVRGNLIAVWASSACGGSIPACTGEPRRFWSRPLVMGVYPRVYGGTRPRVGPEPPAMGLSPRVRGNHSSFESVRIVMGSIPACTGEPKYASYITSLSGVYPRVYGGTYGDLLGQDSPEGLSPRVRGNLLLILFFHLLLRSIPACTGEPTSDYWPIFTSEVYPRVYGGTTLIDTC